MDIRNLSKLLNIEKMTFLTELADQLIEHEGFRSKIYNDSVGVPTIGYGRNLKANGVSRQEARILLYNDINHAMAVAKKESYWPTLSTSRRKVVVDMIFNLGEENFKRFSRMRRALEASQWETAADNMRNSKWYHQVGKRGQRLVKMMQTGRDVDL
jgi:lysozyme